jgi:hypothetical protein
MKLSFVFSSFLLWSCQAQNDKNQDKGKPGTTTPAPSTQPSASPSSAPTQQPRGAKKTERVTGNGGGGGDKPFCRDPGNSDVNPLETCKWKDDTWKDLSSSSDVTFHNRDLTGECGPDCRPSCVTLLLDLDKLKYEEELTCRADELCQCKFSKANECQESELDALFTEHPKCYLEEADCLGPTVYDDTIVYGQRLAVLAGFDFPEMQRCASIPDNELYCRFRDWKVVHPITDYTCTGEDCVNPDSKIYFEYCNIVEEDPSCDDCKDDKCGKKCKKIVEPFPTGWTTFVVSAPISYPRELAATNNDCGKVLEYADLTGQACFLERVEIYYPPKDEDCSLGCPHCHDCPLLELGDTFGPLEVVGFGHGLTSNEQECAACDKRSSLECTSSTRDLDCDDLFNCHRAVDCATGEPLGLPEFTENQCSFRNDLTTNADDNTANNDDRYQGGFTAATQGIASPSNSGDDETLITALGVGFGCLAMIVATVFVRRKVRAKWGVKTATAGATTSRASAANNKESTMMITRVYPTEPTRTNRAYPFGNTMARPSWRQRAMTTWKLFTWWADVVPS